ncbi:MAG: AAA family ATPase [Chitinophagales bacterium]
MKTENELKSIQTRMRTAGYLCDDYCSTVLYLALNLGKPVLVEGPAGVGKTSIALSFAQAFNYKLVRLQCYEGIDDSKAMYEWNYKKQLLHIQAVANKNLDVDEVEKQVFSEDFLLPRPLMQVILSEQPSVLLVDEIDKVDMEFEAMLLELLAEYQITIPEMGTLSVRNRPVVFLTSNASRELSEALKRRCLYLHLGFPSPEIEKLILEMKVPDLHQGLAEQIALALQEFRSLNLKKRPSVGESIDWAMSLVALGYDELCTNAIRQTLNVILKYHEDLEKVKDLIEAKA